MFSSTFCVVLMYLVVFYDKVKTGAHFFMFPQQDAASLAVAILKKKFRGQIFLGCDNHPLSRLGALSLTCQITL